MFLEVDLREEEESNWGSQKALGFRFLVPGDTHDFFRVPVIRRLAQPLAPMNFTCMLNIQISSTWIIFVFITLSPWLVIRSRVLLRSRAPQQSVYGGVKALSLMFIVCSFLSSRRQLRFGGKAGWLEEFPRRFHRQPKRCHG
jgi:hypothetical protein